MKNKINRDINRLKRNKKSQLGATLAMIISIIVLLFILLIFFLIVSIPGVSKHENVLVKENVNELLNKDINSKNSFASQNTIIDVGGEKVETFSLNKVNPAT